MAINDQETQTATAQPAAHFATFLWRMDRDIAYGSMVGQTCSDMRLQQDVKFKMIPLDGSAWSQPLVVEEKVFPTKEQSYIIDTAATPGGAGNQDYWDAGFLMTMNMPIAFSSTDLYIWYRDTIEMLYDGFEPKY